MRTLGIDLAADPLKTAACLLDWTADGATVAVLEAGCTDDRLLDLAAPAAHIGIDSPLGWPDAFVAAIGDHAAGRSWPGLGAEDPKTYRRSLSLRATDEAVAKAGPLPLSVLHRQARRDGDAMRAHRRDAEARRPFGRSRRER